MSHQAGPAADRRSERVLTFDRHDGRLRLGVAAVAIDLAAGNRAALKAYVDLVDHARGGGLAALAEIRAPDIAALASVLDLDAADLPDSIEAVLGRNPAETEALVDRLRSHRLLVGAAAAPTD